MGKQLRITLPPDRARIDDALGAVVEATLISAPASTKNKGGKRDPR